MEDMGRHFLSLISTPYFIVDFYELTFQSHTNKLLVIRLERPKQTCPMFDNAKSLTGSKLSHNADLFSFPI